MRDETPELLRALQGARHFEDAAAATLRPMLQLCAEALAASAFARGGRMLRGMVHLRPGEGYARIAMEEAGPAPGEDGGEEAVAAPLLASATAWRSVAEHRCALWLDVNLGTLQPHLPAALPVPGHRLTPSARFDSQESRQRLLGRRATHVALLPLRGPGGALEGMVSLEAECPAAMGRAFIWPECADALQALADVAALFLGRLPSRPAGAAEVDPLLPVVGATLAGLMPVLRVFSQQEETLLISGPTGAGKSRLARWCHARSPRRQGPFEVLDLVTVPEELQMAELFGWKRGAFTGAVRDSPGAVARADGGTLFIDEIDKLSLRTQAGLLHVLEERTYRALGEEAGARRADVRFIVGTNADLGAAVRAGRFREDLYYRLNVLPVRLPSLDERRDEIAPWARYMAQRRHRERTQDGEARLTGDAARALSDQSWPGNLRQLDNILRRAYALALVDRAGATGDVLIDRPHIAQALRYEKPAAARTLAEAMLDAAGAFVDEAQRQPDGALDLDLADAFRGFVLGVATRRLGRDPAFRLVRREHVVAGRNQHRTLRRELERVEALCQAIGQQGLSPFADLADPDPAS